MKTFEIPVVRTAHQFLTLHIQAKTQQQAEVLALEQAGDHEFPGEKSAEYSLEGRAGNIEPYLEAAACAFCSGDNALSEYHKLLDASQAGHGDEEAASFALIWSPVASHSVDDLIHYIEDHADAIRSILQAAR